MKVRILAAIFLALGVAGIGSVHPALAATLTVTDCTSDSQLQKFVVLADLAGSGDTINFSCSGTIPITGTLSIDGSMTLDGSGQSVTLDGGNTVQVMTVNSGVTFGLNHLTLSHGSASASGGAILNGGTLTITNSTFSNNSAACSPTPCTADGGAIDNNGTLSVTASTFSGNSASSAGGAIGNNDTATITNSTLSGNSATEGGGAVNNNNTLTITDSTLANNSALTAGTTFTAGGAIRAYFGTVSIGGSIVAENTVGNSPGNCSNGMGTGTITDLGYNLESGTDCGFTGTGSIKSTDPQLNPLANNGGPTQTMALQSTSPAIDMIPAASCLSTDQRGESRPDNGESNCDIGAYEFADPSSDFSISASPNMLSINQGSSGASTISTSVTSGTSGTVTLSDSVSPAGPTASLSPTSVTAGGSSNLTISVGSSVAPGSYTVTVTGTEGSATHSTSVTVTVSGSSTTATVVFDAATNQSWAGTETVGASAYDTATVTGVTGITPTGTVTYRFFDNGGCLGSPRTVQTVNLAGGSVPNSSVTEALSEGSYSFQATYSGDSNYSGSRSACEPFTVSDSDLGLTNMPANLTTTATSSAGATVTYASPTPVDEAGDSPAATVGCSPASGSTFPIGTTTVTCTATDSDDTNSPVSKTFTVTVRYKAVLLYKAPMTGKVGSAVPIKIELVSPSGQKLSSSSLTVQALCVVTPASPTATCASAVSGFNWTTGTPQYFTFLASLDKGGGYQFNVKTTGLTTGKTYQLLFRVVSPPPGEDPGSDHADAMATFTLTK